MKYEGKILYICPNSFIGGAERFVLNAAKGHQLFGKFEAIVVCFSEGDLTLSLARLGIKFHILKSPFRMRSPLKFLKALRELKQIIKNVNPDVIHSTMPYAHIMSGLIRLSYGVAASEVWFQHGPVGGLLDRIASIFWSDIIFVNSDFTKDAHLAQSFHRFGDIAKIPLAVCESEIYESHSEREIKVLGYAGRICQWKGIEQSLEALVILKETDHQLFERMVFKICGAAHNDKDQIYLTSLHDYIKEHKLEEKVEFLGHCQDVEQFYRDIDILLHCSVIPEPFGLVVGEAMAQRTIVVSKSLGGVGELIENGKTGIVYDGTSNDLALKLGQISRERPEILTTIRDQASEHVHKNFNLKIMVDKIEDCYRSLA